LSGAFSWTVPSFLAQTFCALQAQAADKAAPSTPDRESRILVVLQMAGGNDGLNTLVPFTNDHYLRARPRLRVPPGSLLQINGDLAFPSSLTGLKALYDQGQLGIVQGVGYPNPNRSHFRSTEIWQTGSDSRKIEKYGWLGRYFDHSCSGRDPMVGINIGRQMPQAFAAQKPIGISLNNPQNYRFIASGASDGEEMSKESYRKLNQPNSSSDDSAGGSIGAVSGPTVHPGSPLDFLERIALDAQMSSDKIRAISNRAPNQVPYPASQLAHALKLVGRLIAGGLPTRIFYVSQGGYDTHVNQSGAHERLLRDLGDAVKAFVEDLQAQGNLDRVLLMTFSEFGRRLAENASGGTDHGAASVALVAGRKVKAGLLGAYPSLAPSDLVNGDPKFTTDFRSVYATVLEHWLNTPSAPILGEQFTPLPIF
jgi:uncharacterized protein (DUF1501 family)